MDLGRTVLPDRNSARGVALRGERVFPDPTLGEQVTIDPLGSVDFLNIGFVRQPGVTATAIRMNTSSSFMMFIPGYAFNLPVE